LVKKQRNSVKVAVSVNCTCFIGR